MAQLTGAEFVSKWHAIFADNIKRDISEQDLRDFATDVKDSFFISKDYEAPSASFSSITGNATDNTSIVKLAEDIVNTVRGGVSSDYDSLKKLYDWTVLQLETVSTAAVDGGTPATKITTIQVRGGTYAEWSAANPILAAREPGLVTDSKILIWGDGVKSFNTLWSEYEATTGAGGKYFQSEADLIAAYPPASTDRKAGDWALVQGTTAVTIWTWNPATSLWEDTENEVVITVDTVLSSTSGNPIANSTVTVALGEKLDKTGVIEIPQVNGLPAALSSKVNPGDIYGLIAPILQQGPGIFLEKNGTTIVFKLTSGLPPTGDVGGDLSGSLPNPQVVGLLGKPITGALVDGVGVKYDLASNSWILVPAGSGDEEEFIEFPTLGDFPATGTADVLYLAKDTGQLYAWSGTIYYNVGGVTVPNASETVKGSTQEGTDAELQNQANTGTGTTGARLFVSIPKLWTWFKSLFGYGTLPFSSTVTYDLTGKKWGDSKKLTGINSNFTLNFTIGQNEDSCVFHIHTVKTTTTAYIVTLGGAGVVHKDGDVTITTLSLRSGETVTHLTGKARWTGTVIEIDWMVSEGGITQTLSASTADYPSVGLVNSELLLRHKQGGNSYGAAAVVGSIDAFDTNIIRGNVTKITATAAGVLAKGAGTGTGQAFEVQNSSSVRGFFVSDAGLIKVGAGAPASNLDVAGSVSFGYRAITAARTLDVTDHLIDCTANSFTVTLPTAIGITGRRYVIKNTGAGVITIATTASQTIDGASTKSLAAQYDKIIVVSNGANWIITG